MQLTMEPLEEILEHARALDEGGFDTIWLAEAYPWWRKHSMEARSSTALSPLVARETERLAVGWGIISPFTRHPIQIAMEARVTQEAAGPGRFYLGLGVSKIFMRHAAIESKPVAAMKEAAEIVRGPGLPSCGSGRVHGVAAPRRRKPRVSQNAGKATETLASAHPPAATSLLTSAGTGNCSVSWRHSSRRSRWRSHEWRQSCMNRCAELRSSSADSNELRRAKEPRLHSPPLQSLASARRLGDRP
jgi:hypothetical protein